MIDLRNLHTYYIDKYGRDHVAQLLDQKPAVIAMWLKSGKVPVDALQRLLEHDPEPLNAVKPLYENPQPGTKLAVLMPLTSPPQPKSMDALLRLYDRKEMGYKRVAFNNLSVARNALAAWAIKGGYEWTYWRDGDMVEPCGDADYFKTSTEMPKYPDVFAGVHTIYRLLSHRLKGGRPDATIVSVCYVSRSKEAIPQHGGGELPAARVDMRRGPRNELKEVPWCGFGGVLVHRSVFEDIIKTQGDEIRQRPNGIGRRFSYEWGFFNPIDGETPGDDVTFGARARKAGHKIHLDMAVHAAHVGDRCYTLQDI